MACADCHMPLVASHDPGNRDGTVHSHRFPAANTAVAHVNKDAAQLEAEQKFLKSGFITVDIFAASPVERSSRANSDDPARGERSAGSSPLSRWAKKPSSTATRIFAKWARSRRRSTRRGAVFEPGSTARVDVVVRTRKIGHFFPGGTVDAFDVWLELARPRCRSAA